MKHVLSLLALTLFVLFAKVAHADKYTPPPLRGFVNDFTSKLSTDEQVALISKLAKYRQCSGNDVVVFVADSLEGNTIEDVSYETFNTWKVGKAAKDNGVLLVIAPNERRDRIETGKGIGGELPDVLTNDILRNHQVTSNLKKNDFYAAIDEGTTEIERALSKKTKPECIVEAKPAQPIASAMMPASTTPRPPPPDVPTTEGQGAPSSAIHATHVIMFVGIVTTILAIFFSRGTRIFSVFFSLVFASIATGILGSGLANDVVAAVLAALAGILSLGIRIATMVMNKVEARCFRDRAATRRLLRTTRGHRTDRASDRMTRPLDRLRHRIRPSDPRRRRRTRRSAPLLRRRTRATREEAEAPAAEDRAIAGDSPFLKKYAPRALGITYKEAGVDIDAGDELVERIKPLAQKTRIAEVLAGVGGFAGLCAVPSGMKEPILVSGTDGVGTKLKVAFATNQHDGIGFDLVAMCVNDVITCGARPLFFLDHFATGKLGLAVAERVIGSIARACEESECALLGGETAELPGMYADGEYDLAGFSVGVVEKSAIVDGKRVSENDVLVALPSSGLHSNGYSLARKIIDAKTLKWSDQPKELAGKSIAEAFMTPTRIYTRAVKKVLAEKIDVRAMSHITGGGLPGNLPRVLPDGLGARIENPLVSPLFSYLQAQGEVATSEMRRTFNMGVGFVFVVSESDRDRLCKVLLDGGEKPFVMGKIIKVKDDTAFEDRVEYAS